MAQYRYFAEGQFKVDPTTGTKCRTGQLNHQFVEQKFIGGAWVGIGDNDGVRYGDVAGAGCRFREGISDVGDYEVSMETKVGGFLLAEGDGWVSCGEVSGYLGYPQKLGTKVLFWGKVSEITEGHMPNKVLGSSDYLTVTGSPATFQCPNTPDYVNADTDGIWFVPITNTQRTVTTAELIGYDLQRTPVKYLDDVPNTIEEIVILKVGEVLTSGQRNALFTYMHLPVLWDNLLNVYGRVKSNRVTQNLWVPESEFITTWQTENAGSATKTIVIPTWVETYDCWVNWGDSSVSEHFTGSNPIISHVYPTTGIKTVKIRGLFPRIRFANGGDKLKLLSIANWGNGIWGAMASAFHGCANMIGNYSDMPNVSATTAFQLMFSNCNVFNSSVSGFDTSIAENMDSMFAYCYAFKQSLASFNISQVHVFSNFAIGCDINTTGTTTNYDATLNNWAAQAVQPNQVVHFGTSKYSVSAVAARNHLVTVHGWTITDGGVL